MQMALVLLSTLHTWAVLFKCPAFQMVSSHWRKLILCPSCTRTSLISRPPSLPEPSHPHYLPTFFSNYVLLYAFLYRTSPCFLACTAHVILIISYESLWSLWERAHGICPFGSVLSDFKYFFPIPSISLQVHFSLRLSNIPLCLYKPWSFITYFHFPAHE